MSTWSEIITPFPEKRQRELELIRDTGLWDDMHEEMDNDPKTKIVSRLKVDEYGLYEPAYHPEFAAGDIDAGRKAMYGIIGKYYRLAQERAANGNEE